MAVYRQWYDETKTYQLPVLTVSGQQPGTTVGPSIAWLFNDRGGVQPDTTTMSGYRLVAEASWDGGTNWGRSGPDILNDAWIEVAITGIDNTGSAGMPAQTTSYAKLGAGRSILLNDIPKNCGRQITYRVVIPLGARNAGLRWRIVAVNANPVLSLGDLLDYQSGTIAYDPTNFMASAGAWSVDAGDQVALSYVRAAGLFLFSFMVEASDVSAAPLYLALKLPAGINVVGEQWGEYWRNDAGAGWAPGAWRGAAGNLRLFKDPAATAWTSTAVDNTAVRGVALLRIG